MNGPIFMVYDHFPMVNDLFPMVNGHFSMVNDHYPFVPATNMGVKDAGDNVW